MADEPTFGYDRGGRGGYRTDLAGGSAPAGGNVNSTQGDSMDRASFLSRDNTAPVPGVGEMDPLDAFGQAKSNIYGEYSYLTGGPNMGLIRQLTQQKQDTKNRYKTNRADVENMYGQLTADVRADTENIGKSFDTGIAQSAQGAQGVVTGLSGELAAQQERRNRAASELGVGQEAILNDFGSTTALNQAMGTVLGQNQNWQGFLQSQKGTALQQGADMGAAVGNTKVQAANAMKAEFDRVTTGIDSAIGTEKSKQAVRKLTEEGSMLLGINKTRLKNTLEKQYGLAKPDVNKLIKSQEEAIGFFNDNPSAKWQSPGTFNGINPTTGEKEFSAGAKGWDAMMRKNLIKTSSDLKKKDTKAVMDEYLLLYAKKSGYSPSDILEGASNVVGAP
jgi:hypothetical protein